MAAWPWCCGGPFLSGFYLGVAGAAYQYAGAGIEAAGAIAALTTYALRRRADRDNER